MADETPHAGDRDDDRLLEVAQVAKRLHLSHDTVRGFIRAGFLPALRLPNGYYRVRERDLAGFLKSLEL